MRNNQDNRDLSSVFAELQQARSSQNRTKNKMSKRKKQATVNGQANRFYHFKLIHFTYLAILIAIVIIFMVSTNYIFASDVEKIPDNEEVYEVQTFTEFEENENVLDMEKIINENISITKTKEVLTEEREFEYKTIYEESEDLPLYEEKVEQEGKNGRETVKVIKTYENGEFAYEKVIERSLIEDYTVQIVQVGTSEFLNKHKVHIGDKMYVLGDTVLRKESIKTSSKVCDITRYLDVKLLDISGEWCKVSFAGKEGYIEQVSLTSEYSTPKIVEQNRVQKLKETLTFEIELNNVSGLTSEDFERILTGHVSDANNVFENNSQVFYETEQKYNVNGVFLAALAIHESGWGMSNIAQDKNNLFGYGSYDDSPYDSSFVFETYSEGIDLLGKVLSKNYLNIAGTKIYGGEYATGKYHNGATLSGVNVRYSTDEGWANKVYAIMEMLYEKL